MENELFINEKNLKEDYEYFLSRGKKSNVILSEITSFTGIDIDANIKMLDVGSNMCFIPYHLSRTVKWDITCLDISKYRLLKYKDMLGLGSLKLITSDGTKISFKDEIFDLVVCNHTIEHIYNWADCINEISRVTKIGGYIYIAMPNLNRIVTGKSLKSNLLWYIRRILKISTTESRVKYHAGFSHNEIRKMFSSNTNILCLNKEHILTILEEKKIKFIFKIIPKTFLNSFSPSNVFIIQKMRR